MTRIDHVQYDFECGDIDWRVRAVVVQESLSEPFRAELRLVASAAAGIEDLLSRGATLTMTRGEVQRVFRGEVTRADVVGGRGQTRAVVRFEPSIVRLRRYHRNRIFQGLSAVEIAREVVGATGVDFDETTSGPSDSREYCVQYDESDLAFVQRLLEDEGISWILDDAGATQALRLIGDNTGFRPIGEDRELAVVPDGYEEATEETVQGLAFTHRSRSAGVVERDWEWLDDAKVVEQRMPPAAPEPGHEVFHPRRNAATTAESSAQREYERRAGEDTLGRGNSNVIRLGAGMCVDIAFDGADPLPVLVTSVRHVGDCPEVDPHGIAGRSAQNYANTFECRPLDVPFRPRRTIARPRIHSLHTAVVTGPPGEEIHTDEHGRIRVRMHWDRSDSAPELSSCWLRVAQTWGGPGWGTVFIPRVGMEVLVAFVDGDPDRPLCIGSVYNGANRPPYALPDERTKSTIRTQSSPGGGGHNELTFEDAAGHEEVYLRAQRNLREVVLANHSERVGVDDTATVGRDRKTTIDRHEDHNVGGDRVRAVGGCEDVHIKGSQHVVVFGGPGAGVALGAMVPGADMTVFGAYTLDVRDEINVRCGPSVITLSPVGITVTGPMVSIVGGGSAFALAPGTATMNTEVVGISTPGCELNIANEVRLTSDASVRVQVAGSRLTLDGSARLRAPATLIEGESQLELCSSTRAVVQAPAVDINADESIAVTCLATLELSGATISSSATGPHTIKGLPIHLNPPGGA